MGKEHRGFPGRLSFRRPNIQRQQAQQKHSRQQNPEKMVSYLMPPLLAPTVLCSRVYFATNPANAQEAIAGRAKILSKYRRGGGGFPPRAQNSQLPADLPQSVFSRRETWAWEPISSDTPSGSCSAEAHGQDLLLPLRQVGDRLSQSDMLQPHLVGVLAVLHLVHDTHRVPAVGVDGLVQRHRVQDGIQGKHHVLPLDAQNLGDLLHRGLFLDAWP